LNEVVNGGRLTRIPPGATELVKRITQRPNQTVNPDEVVAVARHSGGVLA